MRPGPLQFNSLAMEETILLLQIIGCFVCLLSWLDTGKILSVTIPTMDLVTGEIATTRDCIQTRSTINRFKPKVYLSTDLN